MLQNRKQACCKAHDPCNGQQQRDTGNHRKTEVQDTALSSLCFRQATGNDGNKDDIIDTEYDFQRSERRQSDPSLGLC